MQTYECKHCGVTSKTIFGVFLHCFTTHMHKDVGLAPDESRELLRLTEEHKVRELGGLN